MKTRKNYDGQKFNHWTIIKDGEDAVYGESKKRVRRVYVKCDCGNNEQYLIPLRDIKSGCSAGCPICKGKRISENAIENKIHNKPFNRYEIDGEFVRVYSDLYPDLFTTIDLKWLDYFKNFHLYPREDRKHGYYWLIKKDGKDIKIHQIIKGKYADHIDGNKSNNTEVNLREATSSQNAINRGKNSNNTSGYKGVSIKHNRIVAQITCNGEHYLLGPFSTKEEAAKAYDAKAIELFGQYAWTNFPISKEE